MVNSNELAAARRRVGMTQEDVAKELHISATSYGNKENGKVDFKLEEVLNLVSLLKLSINERTKIFLL